MRLPLCKLTQVRNGLLAGLFVAGACGASQQVINGPTGSGSFGGNVTLLPNGNIVVTDVSYNETGAGANSWGKR